MSLQGGDNQESLNAVCVIAMVDRLWQLSGKQPASPLSITSPLTSQPPAADAQQQSKLMQRQADALFMEQLDHAITEMTKWTFYDHNGHTPRPGRATAKGWRRERQEV